MGITYIDGVARGPHGKEETVRFLVDGGATYSLLPNPIWRANFCLEAGSFEASIEMKTTLSIPRTTSRTVRVTRAIQIWGFVIQSTKTLQVLQGQWVKHKNAA